MKETGGSYRVIEIVNTTELHYRHMHGNTTVKSTLYNFCLPRRNITTNRPKNIP